jgi:hypothetical protein
MSTTAAQPDTSATSAAASPARRGSFLRKVALAVLLVVAADTLFDGGAVGSNIGLFALLCLAASLADGRRCGAAGRRSPSPARQAYSP